MNDTIDLIKSSIDTNRKPQNLKIYEYTKIINPEYVFVGDNVIIDDFCLLYAKRQNEIKIGSWVHIASFTSITGGPVRIGNFCAIASGSRIIAGSDDYHDGALMNPPIPEKYRNLNRDGVIMKDFSFISVNSIIFPGITIGEGAIVGAGSIVRENLDDWGVYIMKSNRLVKINTREKFKVYEKRERILSEFRDIQLAKNLFND